MAVSLDHGLVAGPLQGIEDPVALIKMIAQSDADAVLLTPGVLEQVATELGQLAVILRVDGCTSVQGSSAMRQFTSVAHAAELGADAIIVNATVGGEQEGVELLKLGQAAEEARRWGMPLIAEMLSCRMPANAAEDIALASRIGAEMGADIIKTQYPGDVESFRRIVAATGRPVMVAGGPRRDPSLRSLLVFADECLSAGAEGVIFGRNVWQNPRPEAVLTALAAVVHEGASPEQALAAAEGQQHFATD